VADIGHEYESYAGRVVVVDTTSSFVYVGTFVKVSAEFVRLADADAHDMADSPGGQTKERYVRETKQYGVKANRKAVSILRGTVVSLSLLDDVVEL
jgi:hypothetical protein